MLHPSPRRAALLVTGAAALAVLATGAVALAANGTDARPQGHQVERLVGTPVPVIDRDGKPRGFVRDSQLTERDDRVTARLADGFREPKAPVDEEYDRLGESLRVLDPVTVSDEKGETVGYFTSHFLTPDERSALVGDATATVERLLR